MTNDTDTSLCISCGKPAAQQLACNGCGVVQPLAREPDYFALFLLPRALGIDTAELERRYYALSRTLHPDLFHDRPAAERDASLRTTALVNRAYKTLKDEAQRARYWLTLHGESLGRDNERVPPALAALVFEVQEQLEELRAARGDDAAARADEVRATQADLRARLHAAAESLRRAFVASDAGDAREGLAEIKRVLAELHYLKTLVRDVDKELEPAWNGS